MAITDWVINKSSPSDVVAGINPITPIVGTGSLQLVDFGSSSLNMYNDLYVRGLTRGRMRMLVKLGTEIDSLGDDFYNVGFYLMSNDDDITLLDSFGQTFYTYSLGFDALMSSHVITLDYHDMGIQDAPVNIFQSLPFTIDRETDIVPLEIEWKYEVEFGPGILFTLRGSTTPSVQVDFSNLVVLDQFILNDSDILLSTSISEGIYFEGFGGSVPSGVDALIDQVSIFSIART